MAGFVSSIETTGNPSYRNNHNKQKHFLICESCFWCASSLSTPDPHLINDETIPKCPLCKSNRIRVIPVLRGLRV
jgi:rubrerythrin